MVTYLMQVHHKAIYVHTT